MREYLAVFMVAAAVTYLLGTLARQIAIRTDALAWVRERDSHEVPVPYLGGVAMYGGFLAAYLVASQLPFLGGSNGFVFQDSAAVVYTAGAMCLLGVIDDLYELKAQLKLLGQVIIAAALALGGVGLYVVQLPGGGQYSVDGVLSLLFTVGLVVVTVNAVNLVDGLDGLAAGIVGIGAIAFFVFSYRIAQVNGDPLALAPALLMVALAGCCAGFLSHNVFPARMFMGDSGSMMLGLVLAGGALTLTGQFPAYSFTESSSEQLSGLTLLLPVILPLAVVFVPYLDLTSTMARRMWAREPVFQADKRHLHHRLVRFGHSHRRAAVIMWMWAALVSFGAVAGILAPSLGLWIGLGAGTLAAVVATFTLPTFHSERVWRHYSP